MGPISQGFICQNTTNNTYSIVLESNTYTSGHETAHLYLTEGLSCT